MAVERIADYRGLGEARVETGTGLVLKIDHTDGELNAQITFRATHHAKLVEPITAWVATNEATFQRVAWGYRNRAELWYRIVVHRRKGVDLSIPFAELGKRDKIRDLVEIRKAADDPRAAQRPSVTGDRREQLQAGRPEDQPEAQAAVAGGNARALEAAPVEPAGSIEQAPAGSGEPIIEDAVLVEDPPADTLRPDRPTVENINAMRALREALATGDRDTAAAAERFLLEHGVPVEEIARATGRTLEQVAADGPDDATARAASDAAAQALRQAKDPDRVRDQAPPPPDLTNVTGTGPAVAATSGLSRRAGAQPVATDSRPWERTNTDGRPNLSSYEAGGVADFVNLAGRLMVTHFRQRASEDTSYELRAPSPDAVYGLANTLLLAADRAQTSIYAGARVDRMASSHKLARQAVREAIDLYPVPWGAEPAVVEAWQQQIADHAGAMLDVTWRVFTRT